MSIPVIINKTNIKTNCYLIIYLIIFIIYQNFRKNVPSTFCGGSHLTSTVLNVKSVDWTFVTFPGGAIIVVVVMVMVKNKKISERNFWRIHSLSLSYRANSKIFFLSEYLRTTSVENKTFDFCRFGVESSSLCLYFYSMEVLPLKLLVYTCLLIYRNMKITFRKHFIWHLMYQKNNISMKSLSSKIWSYIFDFVQL